jgi:hypothetical protein
MNSPIDHSIALTVEGIGFWASGLPDWDAARAFAIDGTLPAGAAAKPAPQLLAPNERRRAPDSVALALEVAQAACTMAGCDPRTLASVFTSTHGDLAITDYICDTLAGAPETLSPTRFHNSVHNAAAGYWTIGTGCMAATTAISAYDCSFAQGLLEAGAQSREAGAPILLVAYDSESRGALGGVSPSQGLLAAALVLNANVDGRDTIDGARTLRLSLRTDAAQPSDGALHARYAGNAMSPMLPLFEALANARATSIALRSSSRQSLRVDISGAVR